MTRLPRARPAGASVLGGLGIAALAVGLLGGSASGRTAPFPDAPPPAHTGGFGEPTCRACHFGEELNAPGATLHIEGLPHAYKAGETYDFRVVLSGEPLERAGFELAARFSGEMAHGQQAGTLEALGPGVAITAAGAPAIMYAHQTAEGTLPAEPGVASWQMRWRAPVTTHGDVAFHVTANAANYDESAFGDAIYADSVHIPPAARK